MTDEERELHEIADDGCRAYAPFTMADIQAALEMLEVTPSPRHPVTPSPRYPVTPLPRYPVTPLPHQIT